MMNHPERIQVFKLLTALFVLLGVGSVAAVFVYQRVLAPGAFSEPSYGNRLPAARVEIRGMQYDGSISGQQVISIKADRFIIEKRKIGFLRFGLMNVARFENAQIRIYGRHVEMDNPTRDGKKVQKEEPGEQASQAAVIPASTPRVLSFLGTLSKEALPAFPVKNISSIRMEPVTVELHDESSVVTVVSATVADLKVAGRKVVFKGAVKVISGDRVLSAERLTLYPERGILSTTGRYQLQTFSRKVEGYQIETDVHLRPTI